MRKTKRTRKLGGLLGEWEKSGYAVDLGTFSLSRPTRATRRRGIVAALLGRVRRLVEGAPELRAEAIAQAERLLASLRRPRAR